MKRRALSLNTERVDNIYEPPQEEFRRFLFQYGDLTDGSNRSQIVNEVQLVEIYDLGARSQIDCANKELNETMAEGTSFHGRIMFDVTNSDVTLRKLLGVTKMKKLGWKSRIGLEWGLWHTYDGFLSQAGHARR